MKITITVNIDDGYFVTSTSLEKNFKTRWEAIQAVQEHLAKILYAEQPT